MRIFLHDGCGMKRKNRSTAGFNTPDWQEYRLDIDRAFNPDIVGSITDMSAVADNSMDVLYSSQNIEHLLLRAPSVSPAASKMLR